MFCKLLRKDPHNNANSLNSLDSLCLFGKKRIVFAHVSTCTWGPKYISFGCTPSLELCPSSDDRNLWQLGLLFLSHLLSTFSTRQQKYSDLSYGRTEQTGDKR